MKKEFTKKIELSERDLPRQWYNILSDMKNKPPMYLSSKSKTEVTAQELHAIFPKAIIAQEFATDRFIDIPDEVRDMYKGYRTTPLFRATELEKALGTTAKIYYKYEGGNATGSHKLNTALAQTYYNKQEGITHLTTETGAGQWGSALSMACSHFGLTCNVYMVKVSYNQKPYRRMFMETFGAKVYASPSMETAVGRKILADDPECTGSLGIAIAEATEKALERDDTNYTLGSVLNHVCMHQTVIGLEAKKQLEMAGEYPDYVIGCCGGGSNFSGIAFPFLHDKLTGKANNLKAVAVEPTACPTLTKGVYAYDYSDTGKIGPIAKMYTLGHGFIPSGIHAGGLRYHGVSPILSSLYNDKIIDAEAYGQKEVLEAGLLFAKTEGIIPAPESAHAVRSAIVHALEAKEAGTSPTILFCLSGHGYLDLFAYEKLIAGKLEDVTESGFSPDQVKTDIADLNQF